MGYDAEIFSHYLISEMFLNSILTKAYLFLEQSGKLSGSMVDYENEIKKVGDEIVFRVYSDPENPDFYKYKLIKAICSDEYNLPGFLKDAKEEALYKDFQLLEDYTKDRGRFICDMIIAKYPRTLVYFAMQFVHHTKIAPKDARLVVCACMEPAATAAKLPEA